MADFPFMKEVAKKEVKPDFGDDRQYLSPFLTELQDVIGLKNTLALVEQWGGVPLYIPESIPDNHRIAKLIGKDAADALARYCGRERINIPLARDYKRAQRNAEIYNRHKAGESANDLAIQYGLGARQMWEVIGEMKERIVAEKYRQAMKQKGGRK
jgi:Mor family transcriptional regulator